MQSSQNVEEGKKNIVRSDSVEKPQSSGKVESPPEGFEVETDEQKQARIKKQRQKNKDEAIILFDKPVKSDAPYSVYRETVTDSESMETRDYIWWHTFSSKYIGKERITEPIKGTDRSLTKGFKFTIPYTEKNAKKIIEDSKQFTKFYHKEGETTFRVKDPQKDF